MSLWFNENTGDLKHADNSEATFELERAGYRKVMSANFARYFHFFVLKSRRTGKYILKYISKFYSYQLSYINPENYEFYEDYEADMRKYNLLRKIDRSWVAAHAMLHDPQYLHRKLLKVIKRKKDIPSDALNFALSLLPPDLRRDVEAQLIAKAFKQ